MELAYYVEECRYLRIHISEIDLSTGMRRRPLQSWRFTFDRISGYINTTRGSQSVEKVLHRQLYIPDRALCTLQGYGLFYRSSLYTRKASCSMQRVLRSFLLDYCWIVTSYDNVLSPVHAQWTVYIWPKYKVQNIFTCFRSVCIIIMGSQFCKNYLVSR
jgi:hypothetical protein